MYMSERCQLVIPTDKEERTIKEISVPGFQVPLFFAFFFFLSFYINEETPFGVIHDSSTFL